MAGIVVNIETVVPYLIAVGGISWYVIRATLNARKAGLIEVTDSKEMDRTARSIAKEEIATTLQSIVLRDIVDGRVDHKLGSATMVFSAGLELARSEIAAVKAANATYAAQHQKQHDELKAMLVGQGRMIERATVRMAVLQERVGSLTDADEDTKVDA